MDRHIRFFVLTVTLLVLTSTGPAWAQNEGTGIPEAGHQLPFKWGIGFTIYNQNQPYDIKTLEVPLAGLDIGAAQGLKVPEQYRQLPLQIRLLAGSISQCLSPRRHH